MAEHHCSFCGSPLGEVGLLFRASIGGLPPEICDDCVTGFANIVETYRCGPNEAAALIQNHNAAIDERRA